MPVCAYSHSWRHVLQIQPALNGSFPVSYIYSTRDIALTWAFTWGMMVLGTEADLTTCAASMAWMCAQTCRLPGDMRSCLGLDLGKLCHLAMHVRMHARRHVYPCHACKGTNRIAWTSSMHSPTCTEVLEEGMTHDRVRQLLPQNSLGQRQRCARILNERPDRAELEHSVRSHQLPRGPPFVDHFMVVER